jgi:hypothetical protein
MGILIQIGLGGGQLMRLRLHWVTSTFMLLALVPTSTLGADQPDLQDGTKRKPRFTIGKQTTYLTEPVDRDGYIDYVAALNERSRHGITPDTNANVLLWQAFGPQPEKDKVPPKFFELLGTPVPPGRGLYYVSYNDFMRAHLKGDRDAQIKEMEALRDPTSQRPWTAREFPLVRDWLKANDKPLVHIVEASKCPHFYAPLVLPQADKKPVGLIGALIPGMGTRRDAAQALITRAMLRLGERQYDEAWLDLLACHRLGRHVAGGPTLIDMLAGIAIDNLASEADLVFLDAAKPDAKQIKNCLQDLDILPVVGDLVDAVENFERFMVLDSVMRVERHGVGFLGAWLFPGPPSDEAAVQMRKKLGDVKWDELLRETNRWHDRMVAALRHKDREARVANLNKVTNDMRDTRASLSSGDFAKSFTDDPGKAMRYVVMHLMTGASKERVLQTCDRNEQVQRNLRLAFALAAYQSDRGQHPKTLEELSPRYLASIPQDLFTGKALVYRPSDKGYLLYSLGPNGMDDQGRGEDDSPGGDDISVRMPLPPRR